MARKALTESEVIERLHEQRPTCRFVSFYYVAKNLSQCRVVRHCTVCGHEWATLVNNAYTKNAGCPHCANRENAHVRALRNIHEGVPGFVYRVDSKYGVYSKVGFTQNLRKRLTDMEGRVPFKLGGRIKVLFKGNARVACELEHRLKLGAKSARFSGFDGASEWLLAESLDKIMLD